MSHFNAIFLVKQTVSTQADDKEVDVFLCVKRRFFDGKFNMHQLLFALTTNTFHKVVKHKLFIDKKRQLFY